MKWIVILMALLAIASAGWSAEWKNLDDEHRLGGRKVSGGYLQGKVVLVCRDAALADRMEAIWTSFKPKPFVLLGAYAKKQAAGTYPMYADAGLAADDPGTPVYVVDGLGKVIYFGNDERKATEEVVTALTDMASPRNLTQWKRFLDYEFEHLPGRAYGRLDQFRKKFPVEVKGYAGQIKALKAVPDIKKLGALVAFAASVKDYAPKNPMDRRRLPIQISEALRKYAPLKESADPRVAQEAKNALADLQWTKASL